MFSVCVVLMLCYSNKKNGNSFVVQKTFPFSKSRKEVSRWLTSVRYEDVTYSQFTTLKSQFTTSPRLIKDSSVYRIKNGLCVVQRKSADLLTFLCRLDWRSYELLFWLPNKKTLGFQRPIDVLFHCLNLNVINYIAKSIPRSLSVVDSIGFFFIGRFIFIYTTIDFEWKRPDNIMH